MDERQQQIQSRMDLLKAKQVSFCVYQVVNVLVQCTIMNE